MGEEHVCFVNNADSALMVTGGFAVEVQNVARDRKRMFVCGIIVWLLSGRVMFEMAICGLLMQFGEDCLSSC